MSVDLSAYIRSVTIGCVSEKFDIGIFIENLSRNHQIWRRSFR